MTCPEGNRPPRSASAQMITATSAASPRIPTSENQEGGDLLENLWRGLVSAIGGGGSSCRLWRVTAAPARSPRDFLSFSALLRSARALGISPLQSALLPLWCRAHASAEMSPSAHAASSWAPNTTSQAPQRRLRIRSPSIAFPRRRTSSQRFALTPHSRI